MNRHRIHDDLAHFGPGGSEADRIVPIAEARSMARHLARRHRENFSVLTRLVSEDVRDDFAAVYAFCRTADDLGDEIGDPTRSLELLEWFRAGIDQAFDPSAAEVPTHWVFRALRPTIKRFTLSPSPFRDLVSAFEQDQTVRRYETWDDLLDYCRRSADPVGRLVLAMLDETAGGELDPELARRSDAVCTGLQLVNHWQDLARDLLERDRIYLPREEIRAAGFEVEDFEDRFRRSATQGWAVDADFLPRSRTLVRACVERTWPLFELGAELPGRLGPRAAPVVETLLRGGVATLRLIEDWDCETVLHRPSLGRVAKASIVLGAWWRTRGSRRTTSSESARIPA
jgi:squalene synthase HpnC